MESLFGGLRLKFFSENNIKKKYNNSTRENSVINQNIVDNHYYHYGDEITDLRQKVETFNTFFRKLNKATISDDIENVKKYFNHAEAYYDKIKERRKDHEFVIEFPDTQIEFYEFLISYYESIGLGHSTKSYKEKLEKINQARKKFRS